MYKAWRKRAEEAEQQRAALQAENATLRKCVELYADDKYWAYSSTNMNLDLWLRTNHGPEPAQRCLEELKLTNPNRKETNERIN